MIGLRALDSKMASYEVATYPDGGWNFSDIWDQSIWLSADTPLEQLPD
jgi:hypothetical protein